jgi:hypothetical protein
MHCMGMQDIFGEQERAHNDQTYTTTKLFGMYRFHRVCQMISVGLPRRAFPVPTPVEQPSHCVLYQLHYLRSLPSVPLQDITCDLAWFSRWSGTDLLVHAIESTSSYASLPLCWIHCKFLTGGSSRSSNCKSMTMSAQRYVVHIIRFIVKWFVPVDGVWINNIIIGTTWSP